MNIKAKARQWVEAEEMEVATLNGIRKQSRHGANASDLLEFIESLPDDPPVNNQEHALQTKGLSRIEEICMNLDPMEDKEGFPEIYKIAHTLNSPTCRKNHPKWTEEIQALSSPVGVNKLDEFTEGEIQKIFKKVRDPEFTSLIAYEADVLVEEIKRLRKLVK